VINEVLEDEGQIVEESRPDSFFAAPLSDRTKLFLSKIRSH
jgi:ABC-type polar amino acid transport system ATPase subunit